jgi:hypothetical protein
MNTPNDEQLSDALRDLVAAQPFEPDVDAIQRRGEHLRRQHRKVRGIVGVAVVVAAVTVTASVVTRPGTAVDRAIGTPQSTQAAPGPQLASLAASITATPARQSGDATLVLRDQRYSNGERIDVYDLYTDNGKYYFAKQRNGLPAQVRAGHDQGDGVFHREVAAAVYAATGDLNVAHQRMADAPLSSGQQAPKAATTPDNHGVVNLDNYIWENSMDAIVAGSGNPQIRAGVLRLLSTLPGITVTHDTTEGQPTLVITAGKPEVSPAQETWIINANTGVPVRFLSGESSTPDATINYDVTRVSLADVRANKF